MDTNRKLNVHRTFSERLTYLQFTSSVQELAKFAKYCGKTLLGQ